MELHHQPPDSKSGALLIELQGYVPRTGVAPVCLVKWWSHGESHPDLRIASASSCCWTMAPKMERAPGLAPGKSGFASRRLDDFGIARVWKWGGRRVLRPFGDLHRIECWLLHHGLHLKSSSGHGRLPVWPRPESKWRKPEGMLPIPRSGTICFRDSPGALVRFGFHEIGGPGWSCRSGGYAVCAPRLKVGATARCVAPSTSRVRIGRSSV